MVRHGLATGKNVLDIIRDLRKDTEDSDRESPLNPKPTANSDQGTKDTNGRKRSRRTHQNQ